MKKLFFMAAAALVLASCSNEETLKAPKAQNEIAFQVITKNASRGAVTTATGWKAPIYVASAYQSATGEDYTNIFNGNAFVEFTFSGGNWTSPSATYYYPENGIVDFLAYATGTDGVDQIVPGATLNRDGADKGISSMVLNYQTNKLAGKTDVMYAYTPGLACPQPGKAPLTFKHALAWVSVTMSEALDKVKVRSLTLDNVYLTGTVTIPVSNHVVGAPTWTVATTDKQANVNFDAFCPATPQLVKDLSDAGQGILIVPGVAGETTQTTLTLKYEMVDNPGVEVTNVIDLSELPYWEAGKHYTYNIVIGLQAIEFTCDVDSYDDYDMSGNFDNGQIKL